MLRAFIPSFLVCLVPSAALAADILVPEDAASIQAAIAAAQPGDRVLVAPGSYAEQIDFLGKAIIVESRNGADVTTIDGQGELGYVVRFSSEEPAGAVLRGFTITGGFGEIGSLGAGPGGGILVSNANARIEASRVVGNQGGAGGGLTLDSGDAHIENSVFTGNEAVFGAGIYVEGGVLSIVGSDFLDNVASSNGGAIKVIWGQQLSIDDSSFITNRSGSLGSGVYAGNVTVDIRGSQFAGNGEAQSQDGVSWHVSSLGGGGIYVSNVTGRIDSSRFTDNIAAFGSGIYVANGSEVELTNLLIAGNAAACNCGLGGLYVNSASPSVNNVTIADNGGYTGIFTTYNAFPVFTNSIVVGHGQPIAGNGTGSFSYSLYDVEPFAAILGDGNVLAQDPLLDAANEYAPLPGSPAIDAGSNLALPEDIVTDLLGAARYVDDPDTPDTGLGTAPIIDIGAIEFQADDGSSQVHDRIFAHHFQRG